MKKPDFKFAKLGVIIEGKPIEREIPSIKEEDFEISFNDDLSIRIFSKKKTDISEVYFDLKFDDGNIKMLRNGFQSWSPTYEIDTETRFERVLMPVLRYHYLDPENFTEGRSHFFTYINFGDHYIHLIPENNSLKASFELINKNTVRVYFEIGSAVEGEFLTPKIVAKQTQSLALEKRKHKKIYGWTSWYYYYRSIDADEIIKTIESIKNLPFKLDFFQIDDGWQKSIGEWVENEKFKGKLKIIVDKLNDLGVTPGIWLAPFVVEKNSEIFKQHKDWLVKDKAGAPRQVGFNPLWSGHFYALNPMNDEVVEYLTEKITALREMGFRMFKFDFLYSLMAVSKDEVVDATRIERFKRGMETLRKAIGEDSKLLGCGAPVMLEKGLYDYLRIGPDTKDGWEDTLTRLLRFEGRVSVKNSLRNTITRSYINRKYFINDPDVIFLKPKHLTEDEQNTILIVNFFLSDFIFFSDPIYALNEKDFQLLLALQNYKDFTLDNVLTLSKDVFKFVGETADSIITGFVNLTEKDFEIDEEPGEIIFGKGGKTLLKHATKVYKKAM